MGTRAVFTFKDDFNAYHVYKHWDGYPSGALEAITKTLKFSWELPRFEADEFGASFIAANKAEGGDIRLRNTYEGHRDLEFRYEVTVKDEELYIVVYGRIWKWEKWRKFLDFDEEAQYEALFSGSLGEFERFIKEKEEEDKRELKIREALAKGEVMWNISILIQELAKDEKYQEELIDALAGEDENRDELIVCELVSECWLVSEWLGGKLKEQGELVFEFLNMVVWGRKTTRDFIYDGAIAYIAKHEPHTYKNL
jgi:hypothetical protein